MWCREDFRKEDLRKMEGLGEKLGVGNVTPMQVAACKAQLNAKLREFAAGFLLPGAANDDSGGGRCVLFVDPGQFLPCGEQWRRLWVSSDWLHFTPEGSKLLGEGLAQWLAPLLPAPGAATADAGAETMLSGKSGAGAAAGERAEGAAERPRPEFVPRDASLRMVFQFARPDWLTRDLVAAMEKLAQIGIANVPGLLEALRGRGEQSLNSRLKRAGQRGFAQNTLQLLRDQFEPGGVGSGAAAAAPQFEVVHKVVLMRGEAALTARVLGTKKQGDLVEVSAETYDGWLRLEKEHAWMLKEWRREEGGPGVLLAPLAA